MSERTLVGAVLLLILVGLIAVLVGLPSVVVVAAVLLVVGYCVWATLRHRGAPPRA